MFITKETVHVKSCCFCTVKYACTCYDSRPCPYSCEAVNHAFVTGWLIKGENASSLHFFFLWQGVDGGPKANGNDPFLSLHLLKKGKEGFAVILLVLASFL